MRKRIFFLVCSLFLILLACQKNENELGSIRGVVIDDNGQPLNGVRVRLYAPRDTLVYTTKADGQFIFKNLKSHLFRVEVNKLNYGSIKKDFNFKESKDLNVVIDFTGIVLSSNFYFDLHKIDVPSMAYKTSALLFTDCTFTRKDTLSWISVQTLSVDENSALIQIDVAENKSTTERKGTLIFESFFMERDTIMITQWAKQ